LPQPSETKCKIDPNAYGERIVWVDHRRHRPLSSLQSLSRLIQLSQFHVADGNIVLARPSETIERIRLAPTPLQYGLVMCERLACPPHAE
jgi:hypothetical protein